MPVNPKPKRGRKKKKRKKRGKNGTGHYPWLRHFGIIQDASPALCEDVSLCCLQTPFADAQESLKRSGVEMSVKRINHISRTLSKLALAIRAERMEKALDTKPDKFGENLPFAGKRIAVLLDGGRILTRIPKKPSGKRLTKKEKRQFDTEWREPKLYTIYEYDDEGKIRKDSRRYCDGTIGSADDIINLLIAELKINGACQAEEIVFIADGAEWIWNRVDSIITAAGIDKAKTVRVLDYYHAVEHLSVFVNEGWYKVEVAREKFAELKKLLMSNLDEFLVKLRNKARNGGEILKREYKYFKKNLGSIKYEEVRKRNIPIGSGAVESAIRRVVNLRLKSAGMFWKVENAEGIMHLRCQLKSGNWDRFYDNLLTTYATSR